MMAFVTLVRKGPISISDTRKYTWGWYMEHVIRNCKHTWGILYDHFIPSGKQIHVGILYIPYLLEAIISYDACGRLPRLCNTTRHSTYALLYEILEARKDT